MEQFRKLRNRFRCRFVFINGKKTVPIDIAAEIRRRVIPGNRAGGFRFHIRNHAAACRREFILPVFNGKSVQRQSVIAYFRRKIFQIIIALRRVEKQRRRIGVHQLHFHVVDAVPLILAIPRIIRQISHGKLLRFGGGSRASSEQRRASRRASRATKRKQCGKFLVPVLS